MNHTDHNQTALEFLAASDAEFAAGDRLQASEKLWGAATHAVMAVATQREWRCRSHRELKNAVQQVAAEYADELIEGAFAAAEKFHKNFYHDEMEDYEVEADRPVVHRFVNRMLSYVEPTATP